VAERSSSTRRTGRRHRILSLDGGGVRGVLSAVWLTYLEKKSGPVADNFDLIAGTSTGAILACALAERIPASDIADLYRDRGREIFPTAGGRLWDRLGRTFTQGPSAPKYSDAGLERTLRDVLGRTRLGDLSEGPALLVTAYDTFAREAVVFKSTKEEHADVPLWEAAKASASAPTYFPAHVTDVLGAASPMIDGGVVANNPVACAIAEAVKLNRRGNAAAVLPRLIVGSFGTGESAREISIAKAREWGALEWAVPIINVLMDGAADSAHYIARQLISEE